MSGDKLACVGVAETREAVRCDEPAKSAGLRGTTEARFQRSLMFYTKSLLGGSLMGQGKYDEARPLLLAGQEGMKQREEEMPAEARIRLSEAVERLVQFYAATGEPGRAAEWHAKLSATGSAGPAETRSD